MPSQSQELSLLRKLSKEGRSSWNNAWERMQIKSHSSERQALYRFCKNLLALGIVRPVLWGVGVSFNRQPYGYLGVQRISMSWANWVPEGESPTCTDVTPISSSLQQRVLRPKSELSVHCLRLWWTYAPLRVVSVTTSTPGQNQKTSRLKQAPDLEFLQEPIGTRLKIKKPNGTHV